MIPLIWLGLGLLGAGGIVIALSGGEKITDKEIEQAFCDAQREGVQSPAELQYVVARVLMPEHTWPPPPNAPKERKDAWQKLGEIANRVGEGGLRCP